MSLRYFSVRLYKNGRYILRALYQRRTFSASITQGAAGCARSVGPGAAGATGAASALRGAGARVRRLLVGAVLGRAPGALPSELGRKAARRSLFGSAAPSLALVGVSLAAGSGLLSREDELEGLCLEIRGAISKFQWNSTSVDVHEGVFALEEITLNRLTIGPPIAKGCSAIVYAARLKEKEDLIDRNPLEDTNPEHKRDLLSDFSQYPLALKMMFNYDIQSNAMSILRAMYREAVPARCYCSNDQVASWESMFMERRVALPPHPNLVAMYSVFAERVPQLAGSMLLYPAALPARLNPAGYGRNMSLFLLMRRYEYSLADYLKTHKLTARSSLLLLAQLLEAVAHINMYGVAHRDLKSDNILVDNALGEEEEGSGPLLVVTDFGCCLADYVHGLQIPYNSEQVEKGGNAALMAPEIANQRPGPFSVLNYSKSDVWAAGAIAYEIFGSENPFYHSDSNEARPLLQTSSYEDKELPVLEAAPGVVRRLVAAMLARNPNKRPTPEVAANVCQLYLWAPTQWIKSSKMPSSTEIIQWLLCLTTKVLYEGRLADACRVPAAPAAPADPAPAPPRRSPRPEYALLCSLLGRARLTQIRQALAWIQSCNH